MVSYKKLVLGILFIAGTVWGQNIPGYPFPAMSPQGRPLAGATVTILNSVGAPEAVFNNESGTSAYSNTVPANGIVQFYAPPGRYTVNISGQGVTLIYALDIPAATTALTEAEFGTGTDGLLRKLAPGSFGLLKVDLNDLADPTVNNDSSQGYSYGSTWININTSQAFICVDPSVGMAVWKPFTQTALVTSFSNVGGGSGVFKQLNGTVAEFRTIKAGGGITVAQNASDITIAATGTSNIIDGTTVNLVATWKGTEWSEASGLKVTPTQAQAGAVGFVTTSVLGSGSSNGDGNLELFSTSGNILTNNPIGTMYLGALDASSTPVKGGKIQGRATGTWTSTTIAPSSIDFSAQGGTGFDFLASPTLKVQSDKVIVGIGMPDGPFTSTSALLTKGIEIYDSTVTKKSGFVTPTGQSQTSVVYTLPAVTGTSGQALITDGNATTPALSWSGFAPSSHASQHNIGGGDPVAFYGIVRDESSDLTARRTLRFTGGGVTCTDDSGNARTSCDIPGSGGGGITSVNGDTDAAQTFLAASIGTDFAIIDAGNSHTYTLPSAGAGVSGKVNTTTQAFQGSKEMLDDMIAHEGLIVNDDGTATGDFRVESDAQDHAIFVDASTDQVAFFTASPTASTWITAAGTGALSTTIGATNSGSGGTAILGTATAATGAGIAGLVTATGGAGVVGQSTHTGSTAATFDRSVATSTVPIVKITKSGSLTDSQSMLQVKDSSTGGTGNLIDAAISAASVFTVSSTGGGGVVKAKVNGFQPVYSFTNDATSGLDYNTINGRLQIKSGTVSQLEFKGSTSDVFSTGQRWNMVGAASTDSMNIDNTSSGTSLAIVNTGTGKGIDIATSAGTGLTATQASTDNGNLALFDSTSGGATSVALQVTQSTTSGGKGINVTGNNAGAAAVDVTNASGRAINATRTGSGAISSIVNVASLATLSDAAVALSVVHEGTSIALDVLKGPTRSSGTDTLAAARVRRAGTITSTGILSGPILQVKDDLTAAFGTGDFLEVTDNSANKLLRFKRNGELLINQLDTTNPAIHITSSTPIGVLGGLVKVDCTAGALGPAIKVDTCDDGYAFDVSSTGASHGYAFTEQSPGNASSYGLQFNMFKGRNTISQSGSISSGTQTNSAFEVQRVVTLSGSGDYNGPVMKVSDSSTGTGSVFEVFDTSTSRLKVTRHGTTLTGDSTAALTVTPSSGVTAITASAANSATAINVSLDTTAVGLLIDGTNNASNGLGVSVSTTKGYAGKFYQIGTVSSGTSTNPSLEVARGVSLSGGADFSGAVLSVLDTSSGTGPVLDVKVGGTSRLTVSHAGETKISGVSGDGTGKVVCVKSDGNLGTCTTGETSGVCTCA